MKKYAASATFAHSNGTVISTDAPGGITASGAVEVCTLVENPRAPDGTVRGR